VHIDVEHALMGSLESLIWFDATGWGSLLDPVALSGLPPQLGRLMIVTLAMVVFLRVMWRGLVITTFDPGYARAIGLPVNWIGFVLVVMTAIAAVAAFDAVGSIIVIAMFVCPPAAARLMTNRLTHQIWWSVGFAVVSATLGYVLAGYGPGWFGAAASVSAAGMIATVSGVILALACLFAPERRRAQQATA
jgi:manganese/zinc/iron transport system permease protein